MKTLIALAALTLSIASASHAQAEAKPEPTVRCQVRGGYFVKNSKRRGDFRYVERGFDMEMQPIARGPEGLTYRSSALLNNLDDLGNPTGHTDNRIAAQVTVIVKSDRSFSSEIKVAWAETGEKAVGRGSDKTIALKDGTNISDDAAARPALLTQLKKTLPKGRTLGDHPNMPILTRVYDGVDAICSVD